MEKNVKMYHIPYKLQSHKVELKDLPWTGMVRIRFITNII